MLRRAGQSTDLDNLSVLSSMDNVIIHPKNTRAACARLTVNINREVPNLGCVELAAIHIQGGSNMTGTDLYVKKPHCAAAMRP